MRFACSLSATRAPIDNMFVVAKIGEDWDAGVAEPIATPAQLE
jgi:hypothetical protein